MLSMHGTNPGKMGTPFEIKKELYWNNPRRNARIAEVAKRLLLRTKKSVRSVVNDPVLANLILEASKTGVTILVENPHHARQLAQSLPGWAIWTANEFQVKKPQKGCGILITEMSADETVISSGVLIRATGTKWPLPDIDWPWKGDVEEGVLIDFRDDYHPRARENALAREKSYQKDGKKVCYAEPYARKQQNSK